MADDGYRRADLWLSDGWATVQAAGWDAPLYWHRDGQGWVVHTLHGVQPVDPERPVVHVSHYEADAFARWAGARLPTEHEWEAAVTRSGGSAPMRSTVDGRMADADLEPTMPAPAASPLAVGEVWEWTGSAYLPYPGFGPRPVRSASTTGSSWSTSRSSRRIRGHPRGARTSDLSELLPVGIPMGLQRSAPRP